jgi:copper(I)-binding protein
MRKLVLTLVLTCASVANAHEGHHGALHLVHPHAAPVEEGKATDLVLTINNDGAADQLVAIETEIGKVELKPVRIPAKAKNLVVHARLTGARRSYNDSEMVPATFVFAKAGRVSEDVMFDR